jgi:hypothetical protein
MSTHPVIFTIFPMTQCLPMTDFLMLVFSSIRVDSPIIESEDIVAFWSISDLSLGSVGSE